ncbi:MAG: hypothetical protein GY866_17325 [Proteobacteria bacterium]|nr:hypothetical protein [Pseudomonadota bacterium]
MDIYGCMDNTLSDHLKCIVKQGDIAVVGKLPEGYSSSLQHNWESPFQDDSPGSIFQKGSAMLQVFTGKTMKGFMNSFLTWEGSEQKSLNIPLFFEAEHDPDREVRRAVNYLEAMSSPRFSQEVKDLVDNASSDAALNLVMSKLSGAKKGELGNRIPQTVSIKIGRNVILRKCVFETVDVEDPMIYSSDGLPLQMTVTLPVRTRSTLDATDILASIQ